MPDDEFYSLDEYSAARGGGDDKVSRAKGGELIAAGTSRCPYCGRTSGALRVCCADSCPPPPLKKNAHVAFMLQVLGVSVGHGRL